MPIALGTAESSSSFFANQRDTFVHENSFMIVDIPNLEPLKMYTFSHLEECRTAFYCFIILKSDTQKQIRFTTAYHDSYKSCIPNTIISPFEMLTFESLSDMQNFSLMNINETIITVAVLFVPLMSTMLGVITSSVYIDNYDNSMLILYDTPVPGTVQFSHGVLVVSQNVHVVFTKASKISQLKVAGSRHRNVEVIGNQNAILKKATNATYSNGHIVLSFIDTGVYLCSYYVKITKAAEKALLLHRVSSDLSGQLVLQDEDGKRAVDSVVTRVYTNTSDSLIESYFVNSGMIHFTASNPDLEIIVELETDTALKEIHVPLTMGVIKMNGTVFEYVDLLHKETNEKYRVQIKEAPNLQVFKLEKDEPPEFVPPSKINLNGIVLTSDGKDLFVDGDGLAEAKILQDPLETETALQIARTRIVFTERNRIRIDRKQNGQWTKGEYVYKNNLVELPLRFGFVDEVYASIKSGDLQIDGVSAVSVSGKT